MYKVYNYRRFDDYQYGHGELVTETNDLNLAIRFAKMHSYGGREIGVVVNTNTHEEVYCALD